MKKKNIALLYGGAGCESEASIIGAELVISNIDRTKYELFPILIDERGVFKDGSGAAVTLRYSSRGATFKGRTFSFKPDAVFPLLHGSLGEDGTVAGLLECLKIPYVGCGVRAGAASADKIMTKAVARSLSIPTVPDISVTRQYDVKDVISAVEGNLGFPVFVKPSELGSSVGAMAARSRDELATAYKNALALGGERILIERLVENRRELEVAYFSDGECEIFTNPGEVVTEGVYSYTEKYSDTSRAKILTEASLPGIILEKIKAYAKRLVTSIGISTLSRIDFFLSGENLYFNEINTMPGFTSGSLYPRMLAAAGIPVRELITRLIESASLKSAVIRA